MPDDIAYDESLTAELPGFPDYRVDRRGILWRCWRRGRHVPWYAAKTYRERHGTVCVHLMRGDKSHTARLAVLVLTAFGPPRPGQASARHHDNDPTNCRIDNLYWPPRVGCGRRSPCPSP